jgi:hypothetical protein
VKESAMPIDELQRTTTRRTVVATGAKLAYAAPLLAASFQLGARGAGAQTISGFCGHSVGGPDGKGCMSACGQKCPPGSGAVCDGQDSDPNNPDGGQGPCWTYCPGAQGDENPCTSAGLCDPGNFVCCTRVSGEPYVLYIGPGAHYSGCVAGW